MEAEAEWDGFEDEEGDEEDGPVRDLQQNRTRRFVYRFPSRKNKRRIKVEEWIELALCYRLEFDQAVIGYSPQPERFSLRIDGRRRHYVPDFLVEYVDETCMPNYVEAKPERLLESERVRFVRQYFVPHICIAKRATFSFWTDKDASTQFIKNLKMLYPYAFRRLKSGLAEEALSCLQTNGANTSLGAALKDAPAPNILQQAIFHLMFRQKIGFDVNAPITPESKIWVPQGGSNG